MLVLLQTVMFFLSSRRKHETKKRLCVLRVEKQKRHSSQVELCNSSFPTFFRPQITRVTRFFSGVMAIIRVTREIRGRKKGKEVLLYNKGVRQKSLELFAPSFYAIQCFFCLFVTTEGGEANVAIAGGTKADTGGADDIGTVEQGLEELPG